jgi:hypothetical protein
MLMELSAAWWFSRSQGVKVPEGSYPSKHHLGPQDPLRTCCPKWLAAPSRRPLAPPGAVPAMVLASQGHMGSVPLSTSGKALHKIRTKLNILKKSQQYQYRSPASQSLEIFTELRGPLWPPRRTGDVQGFIVDL